MIIIIGPSASGKSTIEKELVKVGYKNIVSYTTRPIRINEEQDREYHFISEDEFSKKISEGFFAESTIYGPRWRYGAAKEDVHEDSVVVVEPYGMRQLKKIEGANTKIFFIECPERQRIVRLVNRGDDIMELFRRVISDKGLFYGVYDEVDYIINNEDGKLHEAVTEILEILGKEDC